MEWTRSRSGWSSSYGERSPPALGQGSCRGRGTVVDAGPERTAAVHLARAGVSAPLRALEPLVRRGAGLQARLFASVAAELLGPVEEILGPGRAEALQQQPSRVYLATGYAAPLRLPLAFGSDRLLPPDQTPTPTLLNETTTRWTRDLFASEFYSQHLKNVVPKSLLVRLMMQSVALLAKAWLVQSVLPASTPACRWPNPLLLTDDPEILTLAVEELAEPLPVRPAQRRRTDREASVEFRRGDDLSLRPADWTSIWCADVDPIVALCEDAGHATFACPPSGRRSSARAFRATLELRRASASTPVRDRHRQPPPPRIAQPAAAAAYRLGAYGWLDGPFGGKPGPTAAKRLHARSACAGADEHHPARQVCQTLAKELAAGRPEHLGR